MSSTAYYRATCGSTYRVRTLAATRHAPACVMQARRSTYAPDFSPEYQTTAAEVARLMAIGSFTLTTAPPCP
jgi:hypothetical protein